MSQSNQEYTARRFSPSFDCELPEEAYAELRRPKRPVILGRPVYQPPKRSNILKWGASILVVVLLVANAISTRQQNAVATKQQSAPIAQPTPSPSVTLPPVPAKPAVQPPVEQTRLVIAPAPRAALVRLPLSPPRAQLVRVPWSRKDLVEITAAHIDETHVITMPYGMVVRATLRGFLENESQLPRVGHIGDMYVVGDVPWIWLTTPGTTMPQWIDP